MTGVWVDNEKIAAIGVKVSRWVTMHGFALNVNTDLSKFDRIIPCGIFHKGVTSMQRTMDRDVSIESVQEAIVESFAAVFECQPNWIEKDKLSSMLMEFHTCTHKENELSRSMPAD
jgi:lipoate-protein ligase B